jgi:hypothetical protein
MQQLILNMDYSSDTIFDRDLPGDLVLNSTPFQFFQKILGSDSLKKKKKKKKKKRVNKRIIYLS